MPEERVAGVCLPGMRGCGEEEEAKGGRGRLCRTNIA